MTRLYCWKCGKMVRDKPIFGTLHICESAERADAEAYARQLAAQQLHAPPPAPISYSTFNYWPVYHPLQDRLVDAVETKDGRMRVKAGGQWYVLPVNAPSATAKSSG